MFSGGESRGGGSWLCPVAVGRPRWSPVETVSPAAPSMGGEASSPLFGGVPGNGSGVPGGHAGPPQPASCGSLVGVPRQQRPVGRGATELSPPPPPAGCSRGTPVVTSHPNPPRELRGPPCRSGVPSPQRSPQGGSPLPNAVPAAPAPSPLWG